MGQNFKEVAHLRTDKKKYDTNYDHIFGKRKPNLVDKEETTEDNKEEIIKDCEEL